MKIGKVAVPGAAIRLGIVLAMAASLAVAGTITVTFNADGTITVSGGSSFANQPVTIHNVTGGTTDKGTTDGSGGYNGELAGVPGDTFNIGVDNEVWGPITCCGTYTGISLQERAPVTPPQKCIACAQTTAALTFSMSNDELTVSGTFTGSGLTAGDPITGSSISFSTQFELFDLLEGPESDAAIFLPEFTSQISIGSVLTGSVPEIDYVEELGASSGMFYLVADNLTAGATPSQYGSEVLAQAGLGGVEMAGSTAAPLFSQMQAGSFAPAGVDAQVTAICPEPGSLTGIGLALLGCASVLFRRPKKQVHGGTGRSGRQTESAGA